MLGELGVLGAAGKLLIHAYRAGAGGKTETAVGFVSDNFFYDIRTCGALALIILGNDNFHV